ncbi:MAG TPA: nucleotidyltransferase family protein [Oscillatoriales cyanobacterium M59_W2019_021]|nr:MAG: DNA polymerase beta [Cyanobacteria bacterium J055]HIK30565.1 nucleotidyltransferase family protein [Oscillatoriales cyanobacterium M4454_W2019_049]HIK50510.1 nucleotidyltransferase family protein [Oscillatoriales cyanobacterium M59_W2019_021]
MKSLEEIQHLLQAHRELLQARFRVSEMSIFGSYARGQQTPSSDLDLLIDYDRPPTLWMLAQLRDYLSEMLEMRVDVVTQKGLKPRIRERVLEEAVKV